MAVQVPAGYGVEGYDFGMVNFHLASHPARCLWPSTASASDAFSAYAIEEPNRWLFFTVQVPTRYGVGRCAFLQCDTPHLLRRHPAPSGDARQRYNDSVNCQWIV